MKIRQTKLLAIYIIPLIIAGVLVMFLVVKVWSDFKKVQSKNTDETGTSKTPIEKVGKVEVSRA